MAKRSIDEISDDSLPENLTKTKIKLCINRGKVPLFPSMNSRTIILLAPSSLEK